MVAFPSHISKERTVVSKSSLEDYGKSKRLLAKENAVAYARIQNVSLAGCGNAKTVVELVEV